MNNINIEEDLKGRDVLILFLFAYNFEITIKDLESNKYRNFKINEILIKNYNDNLEKTLVSEKAEKWYSNNKKECKYFLAEYGKKFQAKVIHWNDRNKSKYFEEKLQKGYEYERYIYQKFKEKGIELSFFNSKIGQYNQGETVQGIEIKHDLMFEKTGNLYIEYSERVNNLKEWVNSGILKSDNTIYYLIGNYNEFFIFEKKQLLEIYNILKDTHTRVKKLIAIDETQLILNVKKNRVQFVRENANSTSKGFLLAKELANEIQINFEDVIKNIKQ